MAKILDVGSGWFGGVFANPAENEAAEMIIFPACK